MSEITEMDNVSSSLERVAKQEIERLQAEREKYEEKLASYRLKNDSIKEELRNATDPDVITQKRREQNNIRGWISRAEKRIAEIDEALANFNFEALKVPVFDKYLCFSNIRELLKNSDAKLGQIERDAGCQPGYMSRLEKAGNTTEPSVSFVLTAARQLGVNLESLLSVNYSDLTPTEKYLLSFLDKLTKDTLADKLDWKVEKAEVLNRMEGDYNGYVEHPLFDIHTFYEEGEGDYPNEVTRVTFDSDSFGYKTYIKDDCYSLRIKNGSTIYLMDIEKSVHHINDPSAFAKEIWIYTPGTGRSLLAKNNDESVLANWVNTVFETVKQRAKHPAISKGHQSVLDAFMKDDFTDDDTLPENLPF